MCSTPSRYFAGFNSPDGFRSLLPLKQGAERTVLLMGGPASGKSTLLRAVMDAALARDWEVVAWVSPHAPDSIEAVQIPGRDVYIRVAGAPYGAIPDRWGGVERVISLDTFLDGDALAGRQDFLFDSAAEEAAQQQRAERFLASAATLLGDNARVAATALDSDKLIQFTERLAERELAGAAAVSSEGAEDVMLSAVTPDGIRVLYDTLHALCARVYVVEDDFGVVAPQMLEVLRRYAVDSGVAYVACMSPLSAAVEHLLFPSISVAFTTANRCMAADFPAFRRIHATRFMDEELLRNSRQLMSFGRRAAFELLQEASGALALSRAAHERVIPIYAAAMDWGGVDAVVAQILAGL